MNQDTSSGKAKKPSTPAATPSPGGKTTPEPVKVPPLFRGVDWFAFAVATLLVLIGYVISISPDLTLEDSGELAVGSMYAGVPHPPGYPVWTLYTWFFTKILPFSNMAWRVSMSSAVAGALACGLIGLVVSRGSSMMIEGIASLKDVDRRWENALCFVAGVVAGMLMGFNGYMWSQSVIVEVYSLSVFSLMGVIVCLLRWVYAPHQFRFLYWAFFLFGICLTNHMSLLVAAMGIEIAVAAAHRKLGRDMLFGNAVVYVIVLMFKSKIQTLANPSIFILFNLIGVGSILGCGYYILQTQKLLTEWKVVLFCGLAFAAGCAFYLYMPIASMSNPPLNWGYPRTAEGFMHALQRGQYESVRPTGDVITLIKQLWMYIEGAMAEFNSVFLMIALLPFVFFRSMQQRERSWLIGLSGMFCCLSVILTLLLNPGPDRQSRELNRVFFTASHTIVAIGIGYGLTLLGAFLLVQYQNVRKWVIMGGIVVVFGALDTLFEVVFAKYGGGLPVPGARLALYGVLFLGSGAYLISHHKLGKKGLVITGAVFAVIGLIAGAVGVGQVLGNKVNLMEKFQVVMSGIGHTLSDGDATYRIYGGFLTLFLVLAFLGIVLLSKQRIRLGVVVGLFALMPFYSILAHWFENEQRGHLYGYWFGHDMFTPPFEIYPEMTKDAILFGGTDPGRFNPTYMIFCESFTPPEDKPNDPKFDRRDVYIITQNALADGTYLNYIRAHYNRSAQVDPPFFQNFFNKPVLKMFMPLWKGLDKVFLGLGDSIEKDRRVGPSFFEADHFADVAGLARKINAKEDAVSKFIFEKLSPDTQALLAKGDANSIGGPLARDLNRIIDAERLYDAERFKDVKLSEHSQGFIKENPKSHTVVRWNRLLLEDAYPTEIKKSMGGVYPDLEIQTPSPDDSQKCFNDYLADAERRYRNNQLKPGEDFRVEGGRIQVTGQVAVMSINGLLTKVIFEENPNNEFFIEESFPLEWMFPNLTPYGIIMKINRQPVQEFTEEICNKDHQFWRKFSERLIGDWITYETPVQEVCDWAERIYLRNDYTGYTGDRKFARDDNGQKAFSKLRSSIGGVYSWRLGYMGFDCPPQYRASKNPEELKRVIRETEFAFKQAFAFCPYSPEAVFRFAQFLAYQGRHADAVAVARTCYKFDPENGQLLSLIQQLEGYKGGSAQAPKMMDAQTAYNEITKMLQEGKNAEAAALLDQIVASPNTTPEAILFAARSFAQMMDTTRLEGALGKLVKLAPDNPEAWYDLAGLQAMLGKQKEAVHSLKEAVKLSQERLKREPNARNLILEAIKDPRFGPLREDPEIKALLQTPA
jgi:tetratricopeptide (TPR) repeat protein